MKVIIAGSRRVYSIPLIEFAVKESSFEITEVEEGGASGIDKAAKHWAHKNAIPVVTFEADWNKFGNEAGPIRNQEMAEWGDALIAIPDKESKGTWDMYKRAKDRDLLIYVLDLAEDQF